MKNLTTYEKEIDQIMLDREYPGSVRTTVIWAMRKNDRAFDDMDDIIKRDLTAKEMVKAMQPYIMETELVPETDT